MYGSSWRRRLEVEDVERVSVISCSTSPQPDVTKQVRTRIARSTEPAECERRRSRKARMYDASCQTDLLDEYGTLENHLKEEAEKAKVKVVTSPSFDYFSRVKQTLDEATNEKKYSNLSNMTEEDGDDYYEVKKAPLMLLLPGAREQTKRPRPIQKSSQSNTITRLDQKEQSFSYSTNKPESEAEEEEV